MKSDNSKTMYQSFVERLREFKTLASIFLLVTLIILLFQKVELDQVMSVIVNADLRFILFSVVSIFATFGVSTIRFGLITNRLGIRQNWLSIHKINILSLLYSLIAMPLISQIAGRVVHSAQDNKTLLAPVTILEKSFSMTIMIVFAAMASYFFLNKTIIPDGALIAFGLIGTTICITALIAIVWVFDREEVHQLFKAALAVRYLGIVSTLSLSVVMQALIILSYVLLAWQYLPDAEFLRLAAAFTFVVLATSIPVGTGGWGVREISAGSSFALFGFPVEIGVASGLTYGVLHLAVLSLQGFILRRISVKKSSYSPRKMEFDKIEFWPLCLGIVFLMMAFQIRLPLLESKITLNAVDLIALMTAINFMLIARMKGTLKHIWDDHLVWIGIVGFGAMISIGWLVGYLHFGSNGWATTNRLFGLLSIFSFMITGVALKQTVSNRWQFKFIILLAFAIIVSSIVQALVMPFAQDVGIDYFNWASHISGFVGDRNAFAFLCLLSIAFLLQRDIQAEYKGKYEISVHVIMGVIAGLIIFSGSRTGMAGLFIILIYLAFIDLRKAPIVIGSSVATNVVMLLIIQAHESQSAVLAFMGNRTDFSQNINLTQERWDTWVMGWNLFIHSPLFGSGLGASREFSQQVIHNLYLWILGEMGMLGIIFCMPLGIVLIKRAFKPFFQKDSRNFDVFVYCLIVGCFTITQDIAYQRCLWLLLGYLLAARSAQMLSPSRE